MKWKVSKRALKYLPLCIWMGECVCMSVHVSVCLSVLEKNLNNIWWNEGSHWNFKDQSNLVQVIFGCGSQISWSLVYSRGLYTACFKKIYLLVEFLSYRSVPYLFWNLSIGPRKQLGAKIQIFLWGPKYLGLAGGYPPKNRFLEFGSFT